MEAFRSQNTEEEVLKNAMEHHKQHVIRK